MTPLNPPRRLLFGPGPSQVAPRVYEAMAQPIVGHLDPYFFEVVEEIRDGLRQLFGTKNQFVHVISGTGSAGMETAISNFVEPGQKLAVLVSGYFAERIVEMATRHGAQVVRLDKPWGENFSEDEIVSFLGREMPHAVAFVHAETSTGVLQDPATVARAAKAVGALTIMDCVTSLGAIPINIDAAGIDVAFSCTQKGLSCPPGLSPVTVSPQGVERLKNRKTVAPIWYMDLKLILDYYEGGHRYHHTAPITAFYGLHKGLELALEEGVENRFARHVKAHQEFVRRTEAAKLQLFVPASRRITHLITVNVPQGIDDLTTRKRLIKDHGIEIAGGFGPLAGKIFRIGLMGPLATEENAAMLVGALVGALHE